MSKEEQKLPSITCRQYTSLKTFKTLKITLSHDRLEFIQNDKVVYVMFLSNISYIYEGRHDVFKYDEFKGINEELLFVIYHQYNSRKYTTCLQAPNKQQRIEFINCLRKNFEKAGNPLKNTYYCMVESEYHAERLSSHVSRLLREKDASYTTELRKLKEVILPQLKTLVKQFEDI